TSGAVTSAPAVLTVTAATLVSIAGTAPPTSIVKARTQHVAPPGPYTDLSTQDLTTSATWSSSNTSVATVSNASGSKGLATGANTGATNITGRYVGVTSTQAVLTPTAATLLEIAGPPPAASIAKGTTQQ